MVPTYSTVFNCLYDQPSPVGSLGRGTHYSVFRTVEWLDVVRSQLSLPEIHDFAVIWDEDHDVRIIKVLEHIYLAGLLSPIQFIGERKGRLTVIVAAKFYWWGSAEVLDSYIAGLRHVVSSGVADSWSIEVGMFDRAPGNPHQNVFHGLIDAKSDHVMAYLLSIDLLWKLGTRPPDFSGDTGIR